MIKKRSNSIEQGGSSNKNMRPTETRTLGKEGRDFEYSTYEHTSFQIYRNQYFVLSEKIRKQRLMEHLGKYKSKDYKLDQVSIFKEAFFRMKQLLFLMTVQADKYKSLLATSSSIKDIKSVNISFDYQISFKKKIRKDLRDIQMNWVQLFVQGSLKRLLPVLNLLRIPDDEIDFGLDITQWHIETQFKFSTHQKSSGCCCV